MAEAVIHQMIKPAPVVWAHVITPRPARVVGKVTYKPTFEATFLFEPDHPDLATIKAIMGKAAKDEFNTVNVKYPLQNGTTLADEAQAGEKKRDREFLRGRVLFKASSKVTSMDGKPLSPPRLKAIVNKQYVRFDDDERASAAKLFYPGVRAIGTFAFVTYESGDSRGVSAYLNEILSLNSGPRINTGSDDESKYGSVDRWAQYMGSVSDEDPTVNPDDEIPF